MSLLSMRLIHCWNSRGETSRARTFGESARAVLGRRPPCVGFTICKRRATAFSLGATASCRFCLHGELEWFTKARFSSVEAIQTATITPARFLGRERLQGSIEVGKRADLVLLDADPFADIRNTSLISAVILRGKLVTKSSIDQIVAKHRRPARRQ